MVTPKEDLSATFQSDDGAASFARVTSYVHSAAKQNQKVRFLTQPFTTPAWLPSDP